MSLRTYVVEYDENCIVWLVDLQTAKRLVLEHGMLIDMDGYTAPNQAPAPQGQDTP